MLVEGELQLGSQVPGRFLCDRRRWFWPHSLWPPHLSRLLPTSLPTLPGTSVGIPSFLHRPWGASARPGGLSAFVGLVFDISSDLWRWDRQGSHYSGFSSNASVVDTVVPASLCHFPICDLLFS